MENKSSCPSKRKIDSVDESNDIESKPKRVKPKSNEDEYDRDFMLSSIKSMMYAFGDNKNPSPESTKAVLSLLEDQMEVLLEEVCDAAWLRMQPSSEEEEAQIKLNHEDLLFVMRRNKAKLKRLLTYIKVLDSRDTIIANQMGNVRKILSSNLEAIEEPGRRIKKCLEFLRKIEDCEELSSILQDNTIRDYRWRNRIKNRYERTKTMDKDEYKGDFSKALQASFCPKQNQEHFRRFLKLPESRISSLAVTIFSYLARETVAEIVELAMLIKAEKRSRKLLLGNGFIVPYPTEFEEECWIIPSTESSKQQPRSQQLDDRAASPSIESSKQQPSSQELDDRAASPKIRSEVFFSDAESEHSGRTVDQPPLILPKVDKSPTNNYDGENMNNIKDDEDQEYGENVLTEKKEKNKILGTTFYDQNNSGEKDNKEDIDPEEFSRITVDEINEAYFRFQIRRGPLMLFTREEEPTKTRLLCLADLFAF